MSDGSSIRKGEGTIEASSGNQTRKAISHCSRIPMFVKKGRTGLYYLVLAYVMISHLLIFEIMKLYTRFSETRFLLSSLSFG